MIFQNDINIQKELKELKTEKLIYDYTFPQLNNDSIQKIKEFAITLLEKKVINNLMQLTDKTIIFVAHRLSIAKQVDRVLVLDQGKLIEEGSHQELINKQGFYYHLFK